MSTTGQMTMQQIAKARTAATWERMVAFQKGVKPLKSKPLPNEENLKAYKANFKAKYGVTYKDFLYWVNKIDTGEISVKDLPEIYKAAYRGYLITKHRGEHISHD